MVMHNTSPAAIFIIAMYSPDSSVKFATYQEFSGICDVFAYTLLLDIQDVDLRGGNSVILSLSI